MRTRTAFFVIPCCIMLLVDANLGHAADADTCSISRAALSFVNLESPFAIDGQCCDTIQRIRALKPMISISAVCDEGAEEGDPLCAEGRLGLVRISDADLVPNDAGCLAFHVVLPIPPDARHLWEKEIVVSVMTTPPQSRAALVTLAFANEGRPQFSLTHVGFDTDAAGSPIAANLRVNAVPAKNPPFKIRYAFTGGLPADAASATAFPPALIQKWKGAGSFDAECLADGSCGMIDVPLTGRADVPLPACTPGMLVAALVHPNADGGFLDAAMEAAEKQKGGTLAKVTPATILSPREEWEIALVEGALQLGLASAGYLFIADTEAIADNVVAIPIPACKAK